MNYFVILVFGFVTSIFSATTILASNDQTSPVTLTIQAPNKFTKMPLALITIGASPDLDALAKNIKHNLTFELQRNAGFDVHIINVAKKPSKRALRGLLADGISLAVILNQADNKFWEWRLYDVNSALMITSKRITSHVNLHNTANIISDMLWETLLGQQGIFCTKIAYCQEIRSGKQIRKQLCLCSPHDITPLPLVTTGKPLAPRWHSSMTNPLLLYSTITQSNVRLMSVTLDGKRRIISNFDGLNMLPSFSPNGTIMVYCLSRNGATNLYRYQKTTDGKGSLTQITHEQHANTISPTVLNNGDVLYCSDGIHGKPRIYYYHAAENLTECITPDGYCTAPSWNEAHKIVAYCKLIGNYMQIFSYSPSTKKHQQLTFTPTNKDECSLSPCGNYLTFVEQTLHDSRIAVLNRTTHEQFFLTPAGQRCSYPSWSPRLHCSSSKPPEQHSVS